MSWLFTNLFNSSKTRTTFNEQVIARFNSQTNRRAIFSMIRQINPDADMRPVNTFISNFARSHERDFSDSDSLTGDIESEVRYLNDIFIRDISNLLGSESAARKPEHVPAYTVTESNCRLIDDDGRSAKDVLNGWLESSAQPTTFRDDPRGAGDGEKRDVAAAYVNVCDQSQSGLNYHHDLLFGERYQLMNGLKPGEAYRGKPGFGISGTSSDRALLDAPTHDRGIARVDIQRHRRYVDRNVNEVLDGFERDYQTRSWDMSGIRSRTHL